MLTIASPAPAVAAASRRALKAAACTVQLYGGRLEDCSIGAGGLPPTCVYDPSARLLLIPTCADRPLLLGEAEELVRTAQENAMIVRLSTWPNASQIVTFDFLLRRHWAVEVTTCWHPCIRDGSSHLWMVSAGEDSPRLFLGAEGIRNCCGQTALSSDETQAGLRRAAVGGFGEDCDMAARQSKRTRRSALSAGAQARGRSWNPVMFMNPQGECPGFNFGVLRVEYGGVRNSASGFVRAKLHPVDAPAVGAEWSPTAHRWEVLLPDNASDDLMDPRRLLELYERTALPWRQGLLTTAKLSFGENDRLHVAYEMGRAWLSSLVATGFPGFIIQHCPHEAGLEFGRHHLHIVVIPRKLGLAGFGACDDVLTSDAGQAVLYESWCAIRDPVRPG